MKYDKEACNMFVELYSQQKSKLSIMRTMKISKAQFTKLFRTVQDDPELLKSIQQNQHHIY